VAGSLKSARRRRSPSANLRGVEKADSEAIEKIPSKKGCVNGESAKKYWFERKYDISILGNIYILIP
jgi:hypothetical protein